MGRTRFFRDLHVWQKAMELAREVYLQTENFPKSETFGLRMQLRRSAVSVASHIAEGHGRLTDTELQKCLGMARGSLYEFETQLDLASGLGFLNKDATARLSGNSDGEAYQRTAQINGPQASGRYANPLTGQYARSACQLAKR